MKKGFTLVELLIVVVIVGIFVAIALPQYKRATERGRLMEGLTNLRVATDYMNSLYVLRSDFTYPSSVGETNDFFISKMDLVKSKYFVTPAIVSSAQQVDVYVDRDNSSGWNYRLSARSRNGELVSSSCTNLGTNDDCKAIGFPTVDGTATPLL